MNNYQKLNINPFDLVSELTFKATRSQGKGGQNVNKVSTKIVVNFDLGNSRLLNEEQKIIIKQRLGKRINSKDILQLNVSKERSQHMNKELAIKKFLNLIDLALEQDEKRIATKPTKSSKEKRLLGKSIRSRIKNERKKKINSDE